MSAMIDTTRRSRALAANASAPSCSCSVLLRPAPSCSVLLRPAPSCSVLLRPAPSCSVLLRPAPSCSVLLRPAPSCSVLLRPAPLRPAPSCSVLLRPAPSCSVLLLLRPAPSCSVLLRPAPSKTKRPVSLDRSPSHKHQSFAISVADDVAAPFDIHTHRTKLARGGARSAARNYQDHTKRPEFPAEEYGQRDAVPFPITRRSM